MWAVLLHQCFFQLDQNAATLHRLLIYHVSSPRYMNWYTVTSDRHPCRFLRRCSGGEKIHCCISYGVLKVSHDINNFRKIFPKFFWNKHNFNWIDIKHKMRLWLFPNNLAVFYSIHISISGRTEILWTEKSYLLPDDFSYLLT